MLFVIAVWTLVLCMIGLMYYLFFYSFDEFDNYLVERETKVKPKPQYQRKEPPMKYLTDIRELNPYVKYPTLTIKETNTILYFPDVMQRNKFIAANNLKMNEISLCTITAKPIGHNQPAIDPIVRVKARKS